MRKNAFETSDVIGNVIGNWLYDQIVQQDKKEAAIIERLERIESLLIDLSAGRIQQSRVSGTAKASGQGSGI
jgi:hypothetical protein